MLPTAEISLAEPLKDILSDVQAQSRRFGLSEPGCLRTAYPRFFQIRGGSPAAGIVSSH